jgi:hypothetical protein
MNRSEASDDCDFRAENVLIHQSLRQECFHSCLECEKMEKRLEWGIDMSMQRLVAKLKQIRDEGYMNILI